MKHTLLKFLCLLIFSITTFDISHAKQRRRPISETLLLHPTHPWKTLAEFLLENPNLKTTLQFLLAGILSFIAAAISSAGGIGGGGLFIPILTIVAGLDLKLASSYSAFMVTGGSLANVACQMFAKRGARPLIDYDIALLSEPCMLLGVSCGVICNLVFPEWLITIFFAIFLAFCTFKTCKSGVLYWKLESEEVRRNEFPGPELESKEPLLLSAEVGESKLGIPWLKLGMLILIWFSFLVLYLFRGNRNGQGIIHIAACGTGYWLISSIQIPLAVIFTTWILHCRRSPKANSSTVQENGSETRNLSSDKLVFPVMALLAGVLGGVFGIGGGMLISPLLLQIGVQPEVTAATCSFMVLFSSSMSAIQYLLLGMEHIYGALTYAAICFIASLVGLTLVQRAIMKHGRASLIVFSVGTVMALSTVLITSFGAVDVLRDYTSGKSMGFRKPC
ncbi:Sulfite exporter TauE/SafE family protein 5 [Sesamum angolense]|uniref:Sulfite exporter TauE/SafE family protein 5 n=1 Tax=Sesamum angolense TaxID=2727404 RepID=A0AAE1W4S1_9LAMI|nr:Sulfite exporter TauE/SafE family protein 5 [Sesamum angolense]